MNEPRPDGLIDWCCPDCGWGLVIDPDNPADVSRVYAHRLGHVNTRIEAAGLPPIGRPGTGRTWCPEARPEPGPGDGEELFAGIATLLRADLPRARKMWSTGPAEEYRLDTWDERRAGT